MFKKSKKVEYVIKKYKKVETDSEIKFENELFEIILDDSELSGVMIIGSDEYSDRYKDGEKVFGARISINDIDSYELFSRTPYGIYKQIKELI